METHNVKRIALADYTVRSSAEKIDRSGWVNFGVDNLFPQYLSELAANGRRLWFLVRIYWRYVRG